MKNILFIIADQHRADYLGAVNPIISTPNLDKLIKQGSLFHQATTPCPLCGPARTSMFTGLYPHQALGILEPEILGARDSTEDDGKEVNMMINDSSLREPPLLTRKLKSLGYQTAYAGKWHLGADIILDWFDKADGYINQEYVDWAEQQGLEQPWPLQDFDVRSKRYPPMSIPMTKPLNIPAEMTNDAWIADIAIKYINELQDDKPFFLTCSFNGPHPPFKVPEPFYSMYDPELFEQPDNFMPAANEPNCKGESYYRRLWEDHGIDWQAWKKSAAVYAGFVSFIDEQVGRLISQLEQKGVLENTVIIYCSDHGEQLGEHGFWHKMQPYNESVNVPLIVRHPDKPKLDENALASLKDIPATILSCADNDISQFGQGHSLFSSALSQRQWVFSEQDPLGGFHKEVAWRMVSNGTQKYVLNKSDRDEFYDLSKDPNERVNLIHQLTEQQRSFYQGLISSWLEATPEPV